MVNAHEAAAELLVDSYLDGRAMDAASYRIVVRAAHRRLLNGSVPVLDIMLRGEIDRVAKEAFAPITLIVPLAEAAAPVAFQ